MNVMVIGSGGREHAIVHALAKSTDIDTLYCLPGNGGIASEAECVNIKATDIQGIVEFAEKNSIDFAAVIPDDPLAMGLTDVLRAKGVPCFGPSAAAARRSVRQSDVHGRCLRWQISHFHILSCSILSRVSLLEFF